MYLFSIIKADVEHIDEICEDIKQQYEKGVCTCALFSFTLVPEGDPPIPKAEMMCEQFDMFKERLEPFGIKCGILVQASIGHGYKLNVPFGFRHRVRAKDGSDNLYSVCPTDKNFQEHFKHVMAVLASHDPAHIMLDDDFRLINFGGNGCVCEEHMRRFAEQAGKEMTREEIVAHCEGETEEDKKYRDIFVSVQLESLKECARAMREGIDSVDPTIQGSFCCVGDGCEAAADIAGILAGKGNPVILRINNGRYTPKGARELSSAFLRAANQMAVVRKQGHVDHFLAETDTCPQNRYSTGAQPLHSHFTGSILEGVSGAKHWITRLATFEPRSGLAYRKKLGENFGFYNALSDMVPNLKWRGGRIPLANEPDYAFKYRASGNAWLTCVLERLGLPVYLSENTGETAFLSGGNHVRFEDEKIKEMLSHTLFLDGGAVNGLYNRGFGEYLGVEPREWTGKNISGEYFKAEDRICKAQIGAKELIPVDDTVKVDSYCYHIPDGKTKEYLFPAVAIYKNKLGGTVISFCGNTATEFTYTQAFSFLNETRKNQLIRLYNEYGDNPVYYPDDAEVYLKAADCPDGSLMCAFFNIGLDNLDEITLCAKKIPSVIEYLKPDGTREECEFTVENGIITVHRPAYILNPEILFLK